MLEDLYLQTLKRRIDNRVLNIHLNIDTDFSLSNFYEVAKWINEQKEHFKFRFKVDVDFDGIND